MRKTFLGLFWVATALLAYWLGLEQGSESARPPLASPVNTKLTPPSNLEQDENRKQVVLPVDQDPSSIVKEETYSAKQPFVYEQEVQANESSSGSVMDRIRSSNPVVRLQAFTELLNDPNEQNIETARQIYEELPEVRKDSANCVCWLTVGANLIHGQPSIGQTVLKVLSKGLDQVRYLIPGHDMILPVQLPGRRKNSKARIILILLV